METTSMPAAFSAVNALAGARKLNSLGSFVPRFVSAVSRLTMVKSALLSAGMVGPSAVCGDLRRAASWAWKCVSPANARVIGSLAVSVLGALTAGLDGVMLSGGIFASLRSLHADAANASPIVAARSAGTSVCRIRDHHLGRDRKECHAPDQDAAS